ncbi:MAG: hypothetical protein K6E91_07240 [Butyrivibrio sp.]|nr:hypothetical protein [Butyrivibrio sp.]
MFMPPLAFIALLLEKKLGKDYEDISDKNAALTKVIEENITGVRTVKAFSAESLEMKKFDEKNEAYDNARQWI